MSSSLPDQIPKSTRREQATASSQDLGISQPDAITCKQSLPERMHEMKIDVINGVIKNGEKVTVNSRAR